MVLQQQEARVFKDEVNLHVHLVWCICWQVSAYTLDEAASAMTVPGGSGRLGALEFVVVLSVLCCGKSAGKLWLM